MITNVDVVVGLAWGDEGKGKVTADLTASGGYHYVCRWAGGSNAGHTVYVGGKEYKTHIIPSGVFYGTTSVIGPACVLNINKFFKEIKYLEDNGFDTSIIKVSPRTHIVTEIHIKEDKTRIATPLGTTGNGIAPCYAEKAARSGMQAKDILDSKYIWDEKLSGNILCEGAQGVWLDLDWGNYPYVTSSTTFPYGACSLGIPPQLIDDIYGVAKVYDTRSGVDPDFPTSLLTDTDLSTLGILGKEWGVTTGRRRTVNWLNLDKLIKAINLTGTNNLVLNKYDILEQLNIFKMYVDGNLEEYQDFTAMRIAIKEKITKECPMIDRISISGSPTTFRDEWELINEIQIY